MRRLLIAIGLAGAILASAVAGLGWWLGRTDSAAWVLQRLAAHLHAELRLDNLRGSLYEGLAVDRAVFETADQRITLHQADVTWPTLWATLRERHVVIERLEVRALQIEQKIRATAPAQPPDSLALPVALTVRSIAIDQIVYTTPLTRFEAQALRADLSVQADFLTIGLQSLRSQHGEATGTLQIGATAPFTIAGEFRARRQEGELPFTAAGTVGGTLAQIGIGGFATVELGTARGALVLTPFGTTLIERIQASTEAFDPAKVRPDWPRAILDITLSGGMQADDRFVGTVSLINRLAGAVDAKRVPVESLDAELAATTASVRIDRLDARLGRGGSVRGTGRYEPGSLTLDLTSDDLNLAAIVSSLHPTRLAGKVTTALTADRQQLRGQLRNQSREPMHVRDVRVPVGLAVEFDVTRAADRLEITTLALRAGRGRIEATGRAALSGEGRFEARGTIVEFDPSVLGHFPAATLNAEFSGSGRALGEREGTIEARLRESRWRGHSVDGTVVARFQTDRLTDVQANIVLAGNTINVQGALGAPGDTLHWNIDAPQLARLGLDVAGNLRASGVASGAWPAIGTDLTLKATALARRGEWSIAALSVEGRYEMTQPSALRFAAQGLQIGSTTLDTLEGTVAGTPNNHRIALTASSPAVEARATAAGGIDDTRTWRGTIAEFASTRPAAAVLKAPATLTVSANGFALGGASLTLWEGTVDIATLQLAGESIATRGTLNGIDTRSFAPRALSADSDLHVSGEWDLRVEQTLNGRVALRRSHGDLRVRTDQGVVALGLTRAVLDVTADRNRLRATLDGAGAQLGSLDARIETQASQSAGRWGIAGTAPLGGALRSDMPSLAWLGAFMPGSVSLSGAAQGELALGGTVAAPAPRGTLRGSNLRVVLPQADIILAKGEASIDFDANTATLRDTTFHGDAGTLRATGTWTLQSPPEGKLTLQFDGLDAITDPNRAVKLTGTLDARFAKSAIAVRGTLRADEGRVRLPDGEAPRLGADVTIVNAPPRAGASPAARAGSGAAGAVVEFDIEADLGERFRLQGRGVDAQLAGRVRVRSGNGGAIRLFGTVTVSSGTVHAYGQQLAIERGTITFNGPPDNPQLNLFAIRKGLPVRVGVQVTGFALEPRATLFSDPVMPDNQRLSWLVLGRSPEGLSAGDLTLLGTAASAILSGDAPPLQTRIASAVGLDELAVRSTGAVESAVVAIGKRVSDKLYVTVERSVLGLGTVLSLRYQFNRHWSLQGQTGLHNTLDLFYTFSFN